MREPRLLGLLQIGGGLLQRRERRANCSATIWSTARTAASAPSSAACWRMASACSSGLGDDLRGLGLHLGHVLAGLGGQVVEVQRHGVRTVGGSASRMMVAIVGEF